MNPSRKLGAFTDDSSPPQPQAKPWHTVEPEAANSWVLWGTLMKLLLRESWQHAARVTQWDTQTLVGNEQGFEARKEGNRKQGRQEEKRKEGGNFLQF